MFSLRRRQRRRLDGAFLPCHLVSQQLCVFRLRSGAFLTRCCGCEPWRALFVTALPFVGEGGTLRRGAVGGLVFLYTISFLAIVDVCVEALVADALTQIVDRRLVGCRFEASPFPILPCVVAWIGRWLSPVHSESLFYSILPGALERSPFYIAHIHWTQAESHIYLAHYRHTVGL